MKIPHSIIVGAITYRVTMDPDEWLRFEHENQRKGDFGHTNFLSAVIYLNPKCPLDVTRLTLWHEVLHALFSSVMGDMDWVDMGSDEAAREESVIRRLESPTLLVLRDNPKLVAYLTA
jgi:hypothetical protein